MRKEVRPATEHRACDVCGRSILKGERTEAYLVPGGERRVACELCTGHASRMGWILESAHSELPFTGRRAEPRRSLWARLTGRVDPGAATDVEPVGPVAGAPEPSDGGPAANGPPPGDGVEDGGEPPTAAATAGEEPSRGEAAVDGRRSSGRPRLRDGGARLERRLAGGRHREARHVHAVPTNAQVKVERAFELFNASEHPRAIAGIARSLGDPWVSAAPLEAAPSEVVIVVAWELSWYRYRVDLGDADQPVLMLEKGEELDQLGEPPREWNGAATDDGRLVTATGTSARA